MKLQGTLSTEPATAKNGKTYTKVTVGDTYLYDWNKVAHKCGCSEGDFVEAEYEGDKFKKLKSIVPAKQQKQATVGDEIDRALEKPVVSRREGNPANCATYLQLKLASEVFNIGYSSDKAGPDEKMQLFENWFKKIKSLWEDG